MGERQVREETGRAERSVSAAFDHLSQRSSRRGFLMKVGKVAFAALGVELVSNVLPYGRDLALAATNPCDSWYLCGFAGSQCGCSNCSDDNTACPGCACLGGFWTACCPDGHGGRILMRYRDCWSHGDSVNGPCGSTKISNCQNCKSCRNDEYPGTGPYIGQSGCSGFYMCTKIVFCDSC